jgi:hypothetical protein
MKLQRRKRKSTLTESFSLCTPTDGALTSVADSLRKETIATFGHLAPMWPSENANSWPVHLADFTREGGGFTVDKTSIGSDSE